MVEALDLLSDNRVVGDILLAQGEEPGQDDDDNGVIATTAAQLYMVCRRRDPSATICPTLLSASTSKPSDVDAVMRMRVDLVVCAVRVLRDAADIIEDTGAGAVGSVGAAGAAGMALHRSALSTTTVAASIARASALVFESARSSSSFAALCCRVDSKNDDRLSIRRSTEFVYGLRACPYDYIGPVRRTAAVFVLLLMHKNAESFINNGCRGLRPIDRQLIQKLRKRVCCCR